LKTKVSMEDITNKPIIIFGATGSVGSSLARRLSQSGRPAVLAARDASSLSLLADALGFQSFVVDMCDAEAIQHCFESVTSEYAAVGGVAHCVGSVLLKPAHLTSSEEWDDVLATNLTSSFSVVRSAGKCMRSHGGSVVLVSSAAATIGMPNHEAIAAAKAGIEGLVRSAAATYAGSSIRFNAVAPGLVKSKMTERLWNNETTASNSIQMHALGRLGEPDDIAAAIDWLLSTESSWITGQVLGVDGGLASVLPRRTVRA
jgi:NAD(P)-dependent dehydrogenase (short-subunit alcohol dehydrogenase family)